MDTKELIKILEDLKYNLVLDQQYTLAGNLREVIKHLENREIK